MKILFMVVFAILNFFGALVPVQNLTSMVIQSGVATDPVRVFVVIGLSLICIFLAALFFPSFTNRLKDWETALFSKIRGSGSSGQLADAMQRIATLEAQVQQFNAVATAASDNQTALATGQRTAPSAQPIAGATQ